MKEKRLDIIKKIFLYLICLIASSCCIFNQNYITLDQFSYRSYVNLRENSVLDFGYSEVYYCLPLYVENSTQRIWMEYGFGSYKIDNKRKIITIKNEPISRFNLPSRSYYIELNDSNLKDGEFYLNITDKNDNALTIKKISYGITVYDNRSEYDSTSTSSGISYMINITPEEKLISSKIEIEDGDIWLGGCANSFDPLVIDISNRKKGYFDVILHNEFSAYVHSGVTQLKFEQITDDTGRKQLQVNFLDNNFKTRLNLLND